MDKYTALLIAVATVITALTGLVAAIFKQMGDMKGNLKANTATTNATHVMVNNKADEQNVRLDQLTQSIVDLGGLVPTDPSIAAAQQRIATHNTNDEIL
jgi:hypothetical protein